MSYFLLSQLLVGIAFMCDIVSFQFRDRRAILACLVVSTAFTSSHYFLLSSSSAGLLMLLAAARFCVAYFSKRQFWMWFFVAIAVVTLALTYREPPNIIAFVASILMSFASFRIDDKGLRLWMMLGTSTWLTHNIVIGSPAAVALELFFLISNFVGFWRFYVRVPRTAHLDVRV